MYIYIYAYIYDPKRELPAVRLRVNPIYIVTPLKELSTLYRGQHWPSQYIRLRRGYCARITHHFILPTHLHCPPWCNEQALVRLSNREIVDASRGHTFHCKMTNNRFFCFFFGLIYLAIYPPSIITANVRPPSASMDFFNFSETRAYSYYCEVIGQYKTPLPTSRVYAIHYTIWVLTISCNGRAAMISHGRVRCARRKAGPSPGVYFGEVPPIFNLCSACISPYPWYFAMSRP